MSDNVIAKVNCLLLYLINNFHLPLNVFQSCQIVIHRSGRISPTVIMMSRSKPVRAAHNQTLSAYDRAEMQRVRKAEMAEYRRKVAEDEAIKEAEHAEVIRMQEEALARERFAETERQRIAEEARAAAAVVTNRIRFVYRFFMELFLRKEFRSGELSEMPIDLVKTELLRQFDVCRNNEDFCMDDAAKLTIFHFRCGLELIVSNVLLERQFYDNMQEVQHELHFACYNAQQAFAVVSSFAEKRFITCIRLLGGMYINGFFYTRHNKFNIHRQDQQIYDHVLFCLRAFMQCSQVETAIKGSYPLRSISRTIKMAGDNEQRYAMMIEIAHMSSTLIAYLCPNLTQNQWMNKQVRQEGPNEHQYQHHELERELELERAFQIPHPEFPVVTPDSLGMEVGRGRSMLSGIKPTIFQPFGKHLDVVTALVLHDRRLYSASGDGTICVWDLTVTGTPPVKLYTLKGHEGEIHGLTVCPYTARLFSCSADGTIGVWDLAPQLHSSSQLVPQEVNARTNTDSVQPTADTTQNDLIFPATATTNDINANTATNHDASNVASPACVPPALSLTVKYTAGKPVKIGELLGHEDVVYTLLLTHQGPGLNNTNLLISGSWDQWIMIWDISEERNEVGHAPQSEPLHRNPRPKTRYRHKLTGHYECVECLAISNDNTRLFSGDANGSICVWDICPELKKPVKIVALVGVHGSKVTELLFNADNTRLFSSSSDPSTGVIVWDLTTATVIPPILGTLTAGEGQTDGVRSMSLTHDETALVTGSHNNAVTMWTLRSSGVVEWQACTTFAENTRGVSALVWCKNYQGTNVYNKIYIGLLFGQLIELLSC